MDTLCSSLNIFCKPVKKKMVVQCNRAYLCCSPFGCSMLHCIGHFVYIYLGIQKKVTVFQSGCSSDFAINDKMYLLIYRYMSAVLADQDA